MKIAVQDILSRFHRAIRNETGATFSNDHLRELAGHGFLHWLAQLEADELCVQIGVEPPPRDHVLALLLAQVRKEADDAADKAVERAMIDAGDAK